MYVHSLIPFKVRAIQFETASGTSSAELTLKVPEGFMRTSQPYEWKLHKIVDIKRNFDKNISITVPADDLAPLGAGSSAGTVLTKFRSHLYMTLTLQWLMQFPPPWFIQQALAIFKEMIVSIDFILGYSRALC